MKPNFLIAIFDDDLKSAAYLSVLPGLEISLESTGNLSEKDKLGLNALIESFKNRPPRIKSEVLHEQEIIVGLQPLKPESSDYLSAIAEELNIAGYTAKIVPAALKPILIYYSIKLNRKQREDFMGELVNVPYDIEEEPVEQLKSILMDIEEYKFSP